MDDTTALNTPPATSKLPNAPLSDSASSVLPGELSTAERAEHDAGLNEAGAGDETEGTENWEGQKAQVPERQITLDVLPPSPPLTRPTSYEQPESDPIEEQHHDSVHGVAEPTEVDIGEWHPLDQTRNSTDLNRAQETTIVGDIHALDADEKHTSPAAPLGQPSVNLRISTEPRTSATQPWDHIDPPPDNNDYYSTLGTTKFGTMQKHAHRGRPQIPHSTYYFGPPPVDAAYGTNPVGHIGVHHPREVFRIERDYTGGELVQFSATYPLELEGRITPTQFLETINAINELLISAHSIRHSFINNALAVFTLQISRLVVTSHYDKEMRRLEFLIQDLNTELYNPVGLHIRWPRKVAFMFLEVEYY